MLTNNTYTKFLQSKNIRNIDTGMSVENVNPLLFDFQRDITIWALKKGRACIFGDCGLGKTPIQLSWANEIQKNTGDVLIVAPLAVSTQTVAEGRKFGVDVEYSRSGKKTSCGITITNYEMLNHFNADDYAGVVLDESSILKSYTGKIRNEIIGMFSNTPYRLACTATPAPNDLMELGNHAEYMGVMTRTEMLSMFFVHDSSNTQKWRLKGHAQDEFWQWVCNWAVMIRKPSDLGYDDCNFILPPLNIHEIIVDVDHSLATDTLFQMEAHTLQERQKARKDSTGIRCYEAARIINKSDEPWIIWCDRNDESHMLKQLIDESKEIKGSDSHKYKEETMLGFSGGSVKRLVTKPSIAGFGMNWQHCNNVIFVGLSDSYEKFYQAVRRSWRFGQKKPVDCYIITASTEGAIVANIKRKEQHASKMADGMVVNMHVYNEKNIKKTSREVAEYKPETKSIIPEWLRSVECL